MKTASLSLVVGSLLSSCGGAGSISTGVTPKTGASEANVAARVGDSKPAGDARAGGDAKTVADDESRDVPGGVDAKTAGDTKADDDGKRDTARANDAKAGSPKTGRVALSDLYWATGGQQGHAVIDMIDVFDPDNEDNDPVWALAEAHGHPYGIDEHLPEDATLPVGFAKGDAWTVATVEGTSVTGKAVRFGATGGASETHFTVVLDVDASGLVARSGDWKGPVPTLRKAEPVDTTKGAGKALVAAIGPGLAAAAKGRARRIMRRPGFTLGADSIVVVEGRFPRGFTHMVVVMHEQPGGDEDPSIEHISGMLLADGTGRIEPIAAPEWTIDGYRMLYLVDLDGDAQDELVYESFYYEGSYTLVMRWDEAGAPERRVLEGDGA
ncbi:MAG: hypothetical protein K0V04_00785 [Deltaproteobacteria bacterium]|nr:hypothetical protein [Deltaproteobacteria bacterium]